MKIQILSARLFDPGSPHHLKTAHVTIDKGVIVAVGDSKDPDARQINGKGMWLSAGWFDLWADIGDPGHENREDQFTGREAAARGGFTGIAVLPNTKPVTSTKNDVKYLTSHNEEYVTAIYPYGAVTHENDGKNLTEMIDLAHAGAVAFTDGEVPMMDSELVIKSLQYLQKLDKWVMQKPYDTSLASGATMHEGYKSTLLGLTGLPALAEEIMVQRDLSLLEYAGGKLHFATLSTSGAMRLIKRAKQRELQVSASVAAHQLVFTDDAMPEFDTNFKVMPPFRSLRHKKALLKGLQENTIDVIVSAHRPHDPEGKQLEYDLAEFGVTALQTVGHCLVKMAEQVPMEVLLEKITIAPRRLLNLEIPKLQEGSQAELTLFDPLAKWTLNRNTNASRSENSPFWLKELTGKAVLTMRGRHIIENF